MSDTPSDPVALTLLLHLARRKLELAEDEMRLAARGGALPDRLLVRADQCASTVNLIRIEIGDMWP